MYLRNNTAKRKKILKIDEDNLTPRLLKYVEHTNREGVSDVMLDLKLYCKVDASARSDNKSNLSASQIAEKIDLRLSSKGISYYRKLGALSKKSDFVREQKQKQTLPFSSAKNRTSNTQPVGQPGVLSSNINQATGPIPVATQLNFSQVNSVVDNYVQFRQKNTAQILKDSRYVGFVDFSNNLEDGKLQKKLIISHDDREIEQNTSTRHVLAKNSFKNIYNRLIEGGIDPAFLFEDDFGKKSYLEQVKGLTGKIKARGKKDKFLINAVPLIDSISSQIGNDNSNLRIETIVDDNNKTILSLNIKISLSKLQAIGEKIYVLMFCKSKDGVYLESNDYFFRVQDILDQIEYNVIDYNIKSTRLNTGVSLLSLKGKNKYGKVDVNVLAKKIKRSTPFELTTYKSYENVKLLPNQRKVVRDGSVDNRNKHTPRNFKPSETIFYRTTLNFNDKNYQNFKSASDKGRFKEENVPYCTIHARTSKDGQSVLISYENISENIVGIRPRKYRFSGSVKGEMLPIFAKVEAGFPKKLEEFINTRGTLSSFSINDYDVYRTKNYMYVAECMMKNGETKLAAAYFIHNFKERDGSVLIDNIKINSSKPIIDSSEFDFNDRRNIKRTVTLEFKIRKIENEIDKILQNLFGDLFEIFKEDLQKIKDLQGLVYSVEIIRINKSTGENETIGKVTADKDGDCLFRDMNNPALADVTYVLSPRVSPAKSLISNVNETISKMGKKTIFQNLNYVTANNVKNYNDRDNLIWSAVGNKFGRRNVFLKSLIERPGFILDKNNFDVFLNTETGDIEYVDLDDAVVTTNKKIIIANDSISEIPFVSERSLINSRKNTIQKRYFDLSFTVMNDFFVDFYAIFIKEVNNVYLDGVMHSKDSLSRDNMYSYLVEHNGSFGQIEYYAVPFFKDGTISAPILVTAQIINSEIS